MDFSLKGIKVIQTAWAMAAPMTGRLLADWGADVIWVEHPVRGDMFRSTLARRGGKAIMSDIDYGAENNNRNKRGMTLDLSKEGAREILYKLLEKADVFLANFRPRELTKFKVEYGTLSQLNLRLIYANLTGYGKRGPDKNFPALEHTGYFCRSGIEHVLRQPGSPPVVTPLGMGDHVAGMALALGIMAALFVRERTGMGQEVDVSLLSAGVYTLSFDIAGALVTGQDRQQVDRKEITNAISAFYETKDGRWLRLGMTTPDPYWSRFCQAIEREDLEHDPRFESFEPRTNNHAALFSILEKVFLSKTLEEWKVILNEKGLLWGPVQSLPEIIADPQARANDLFVPFDHPTYGRIELVTSPVKLSKTPASIRMPAPELGQHTEEILLEHGYTWKDIEQFKEQAAIA
ncbi:CaiB/BaiF CoA transferase family protein [Chloroflexota bacterium]